MLNSSILNCGEKVNKIIVTGIVIGLVIGLALGIFIGIIILPTQTGVGTNNQVQVSGTIQEQNPSKIYFVSISKTISTSAIITNGQYSVVLVGNQSYAVLVSYEDTQDATYTIYVPSGVTTFTADF